MLTHRHYRLDNIHDVFTILLTIFLDLNTKFKIDLSATLNIQLKPDALAKKYLTVSSDVIM